MKGIVMDEEHLDHFRTLGEWKQAIRERARELIGEGIEPIVVRAHRSHSSNRHRR